MDDGFIHEVRPALVSGSDSDDCGPGTITQSMAYRDVEDKPAFLGDRE